MGKKQKLLWLIPMEDGSYKAKRSYINKFYAHRAHGFRVKTTWEETRRIAHMVNSKEISIERMREIAEGED